MFRRNSAIRQAHFALAATFLTIFYWAVISAALAAEPGSPPGAIVDQLGIKGGLAVQIGGDAENLAANPLAATGRFLVQILDKDVAAIAAVRQRLSGQNAYGFVSADALPASDGLPFAENLVNVVVLAPIGG